MSTTRLIRDASTLAREHTESAVTAMAELLSSMDPRVRLDAAKAILDRGHGKPANTVLVVPGNRADRQRLATMTDEDLDAEIDAEIGDIPVLPPPAAHATLSLPLQGELREPDHILNDPLLS